MSKLAKFKAALAKALQQLGSVTTDKGVLAWDSDDDLKAGDAVFIEDQDGNRTAAADGDYITEDGKKVVVVDGKVSDITDPESEVADEFGTQSTDKGTLTWEGSDDLKEGDAVFIQGEDGENAPAPDGDYRTEDGKVITVKDGTVSEIREAGEEVTEQDFRAMRFARIRAAMEEETFYEKFDVLAKALADAGLENFYIEDFSDSFAIVHVWDDSSMTDTIYRYEIAFNEDGTVTIGEKEEVKSEYVPVDAPDNAAEDLRKENAALKAEIAKLKKAPAGKPAHEEIKTTETFRRTGDKGLDRLAQRLGRR